MRSSLPLNSRCSRKCDTPASSAGSSRAPTPTQAPTATELGLGHALGDDAQARTARVVVWTGIGGWSPPAAAGRLGRSPRAAPLATAAPRPLAALAASAGPRSPNASRASASKASSKLTVSTAVVGRRRPSAGAAAGRRPASSPPSRLDVVADRGEAHLAVRVDVVDPHRRSRRRGRARPPPG